MTPTTYRILFALFLIAHGAVTMSLANVPAPAPGTLRTPFLPSWGRNDVDPAWPAVRLGIKPAAVRTLGWLLWLAALILFAAAGAGLLGLLGLNAAWQPLAAAGAVASLILLALYWHPWLILGVLINIAVLVGTFSGQFTRWFPR